MVQRQRIGVHFIEWKSLWMCWFLNKCYSPASSPCVFMNFYQLNWIYLRAEEWLFLPVTIPFFPSTWTCGIKVFENVQRSSQTNFLTWWGQFFANDILRCWWRITFLSLKMTDQNFKHVRRRSKRLLLGLSFI